MFLKKSKFDIPASIERNNVVIKKQKNDLFFMDAYKKLEQLRAIRLQVRKQVNIAKRRKQYLLVA